MRPRPARGAWIEMFFWVHGYVSVQSRAPHGARGLKSFDNYYYNTIVPPRPARGAWIEILPALLDFVRFMPRPARGAWIEIKKSLLIFYESEAAPRTGRVD